MAFLKKATPSAPPAPFTVPSLRSVSPEYAALLDKQDELVAALGASQRECHEITEKIAADTSVALAPRIAEILGDAPDSKALLRARLVDSRRREADLTAALEVLRARIRDAASRASIIAADIARPEYSSRVNAVAKALEAAEQARAHLMQLIDEMDAEEIRWTRLGPMQPNFLGDRNDGFVHRYVREAKELGYYNAEG